MKSNVERQDYAGSASCEVCHSEIYKKWAASPMRRMTRLPSPSHGEPPFDGRAFHFKGDTVTLSTHDEARFMRVERKDEPAEVYKVTRVIGGRYREDFAGRQVREESGASKPIAGPDEPVLPVSWMLFDQTLRYKGYSVMVKERPHLGAHGAPWRKTCIFCHNTVPYLSTVFDDLDGGKKTYQGSVTDGLLPDARRWRVEPKDGDLLAAALRAEVLRLDPKRKSKGIKLEDELADAIDVTAARFDEQHLVEVGIGCESCHNGSRGHVEEQRRLPSFAPRGPLVKTVTPDHKEGTKAEQTTHVCARCHTVLFSRYPYTWEGGQRKTNPGGSTINSGEARDFLLGGCASQMTCTACHDPHTEDSKAKLAELGTLAGNGVCVKCHGKYQGDAALGAHTHHDPKGQGSACLACHMPKKQTGLGYDLGRYHRIGSPTDRDRVEKDRPIECALCHEDKSVKSLVGSMEQWWSKKYSRRALEVLYGEDLDATVISSTLAHGKPHELITAAGVIKERNQKGNEVMLAEHLSHEFPLVRYYARAALEKTTGRKVDIDLDGDEKSIKAGASAWLAAGGKKR